MKFLCYLLFMWVACILQAAPAFGQSSDNFNYTGNLSSNWLGMTTGFTAANGTLYGSGIATQTAWYSGTFTADQYSCVTVSAYSSADTIMPAVRMTSNANGYTVYYNGTWQLTKAGGGTQLITSSTPAITLGHEYCAIAAGSTISLKDLTANTTILSATDTTYTSGNPGINTYGNHPANTISYWRGGNGTPTPMATAPTFSPDPTATGGRFATAQTVTITCSTSGATAYYTTDGSAATTSSTAYTSPLTVSGIETINAICSAPGYSTSLQASASYKLGSVTWYISLAGGTADQCTGLSPNAYPGSGSAQTCALSDPHWLLKRGMSTPTWRDDYIGGDTVQVIDAGPYYIGQRDTALGIGTDWQSLGFNECSDATKCGFPPIPRAGSAGHMTKWLGYCVYLGTGCHQATNLSGKNLTTFFGVTYLYYIFSAQQAQYLYVQGFDFNVPTAVTCSKGGLSRFTITQTSLSGTTATYAYTTTYGYGPVVNEPITVTGTTNGGGIFNGQKQILTLDTGAGTFTVGGFASGTVAAATESGLSIPTGYCNGGGVGYALQVAASGQQGASNSEFHDLRLKGARDSGLSGSHLNQTTSDTVTFDHLWIEGNGLAGFNSADDTNCPNCENIGTINLSYVYSMFNGCVPVNATSAIDPTTGTDVDGYKYCTAQQTSGYGDGIVFIASNDTTYNIDHSFSGWNTQDSFDLLHMGDDQTHNVTLNLTNNWAVGSMGQTYKVGGGSNTYAVNNLSGGNCRAMRIGTGFPMTYNPSGWNSLLQDTGDSCRADGDQWLISLLDGKTVEMFHNTTYGEGATMYDIQCSQTGRCTNSFIFHFRDNVSIGYVDRLLGVAAAGWYWTGFSDPLASPGSYSDHNSWYGMKFGNCAQDGSETNAICTDPLLTSESNIDAVVPTLTASSPVLHVGLATGNTSDYYGNSWATPLPSLGFAEYGTGPSLPVLNYRYRGSHILKGSRR